MMMRRLPTIALMLITSICIADTDTQAQLEQAQRIILATESDPGDAELPPKAERYLAAARDALAAYEAEKSAGQRQHLAYLAFRNALMLRLVLQQQALQGQLAQDRQTLTALHEQLEQRNAARLERAARAIADAHSFVAMEPREGAVVLVLSENLFARSGRLARTSGDTLRDLSRLIIQHPGYSVQLRIHPPSGGDPRGAHLSRERLDNLSTALRFRGVPAARFESVAPGPGTNGTRMEIVLTPRTDTRVSATSEPADATRRSQ